ncbi:MAG TPA: glycosyltransferase family 4 protein [Vicinamibacterales bacterium]|nr:glycosyltransferase family 4 protein [Vicinamibacterales bacterium]
MRVAVVARSVFPFHGVGGLERHVYDLVRALAARDVAVTLITQPPRAGQPAGAIDPAVRFEFVPYRTFPLAGRRGTTVLDRSTAYPLFGARAGRRALELVRRGEIDLVHGLGASVLGYARARRSAAAPLVFNPQGLEEFGATDPSRARLKRAAYLPLRRAVRACARAADAVIATDLSLQPAVLQHLGVPAARVHVIPNALDLAAIDARHDSAALDRARVRARADLGDDEIVLLSVGRLERNKGFHVLLAALAAARDHGTLEGRRWRWVLIGDGPFRPRLEALTTRLSLVDRVQFAGRLPDADVHAWYDLATLFVHPTLYEGSSLVTLEAMAHRRAVVATTAGGLPDKVRPHVNGWLVPPGDPGALAAAISGALADPNRLVRFGRAGRTIVEHEFSWTAAGDATVALYRELMRTR